MCFEWKYYCTWNDAALFYEFQCSINEWRVLGLSPGGSKLNIARMNMQ